ncbi:MAG: hypothetical protein ACTS7I_01595 [Candidatus Hodgkinia cicadicola]
MFRPRFQATEGRSPSHGCGRTSDRFNYVRRTFARFVARSQTRSWAVGRKICRRLPLKLEGEHPFRPIGSPPNGFNPNGNRPIPPKGSRSHKTVRLT